FSKDDALPGAIEKLNLLSRLNQDLPPLLLLFINGRLCGENHLPQGQAGMIKQEVTQLLREPEHHLQTVFAGCSRDYPANAIIKRAALVKAELHCRGSINIKGKTEISIRPKPAPNTAHHPIHANDLIWRECQCLPI
ncbi:MAG: hypothetical protein FJY85_15325, partial [Deltaproteobacteria bacterium]|nr:hypothetical protein [Deltaproteobacteria bacterium]